MNVYTRYSIKMIKAITFSFYFILFILFTLPLFSEEADLQIEFQTENESADFVHYMRENITIPANTSVKILVYSMAERSERYSFDSSDAVILEQQPAVIKFMVKTEKKGSRSKVKFFELAGSSYIELIRLSTKSINTYLSSNTN